MFLLVPAREVFKTPKIVPAIENAEGFGIDLGDGDMEMGTAIFDVPNNEAGSGHADIEFGIDGFQKR